MFFFYSDRPTDCASRATHALLTATLWTGRSDFLYNFLLLLFFYRFLSKVQRSAAPYAFAVTRLGWITAIYFALNKCISY